VPGVGGGGGAGAAGGGACVGVKLLSVAGGGARGGGAVRCCDGGVILLPEQAGNDARLLFPSARDCLRGCFKSLECGAWGLAAGAWRVPSEGGDICHLERGCLTLTRRGRLM
jgi:hypothetical protein